jgi:4-amino-4-deoxy-L-arabinose transferase-like glycosyltransferase
MWKQIKLDSWTYDEQLHMQSSAEWLSARTTPSDPFNPPLSKLPILLSVLPAGNTELFFSYFSDPFLVVPRSSVLLLTLLTALVLWYFVRDRYSHTVGWLAVFFFIFEPMVLAHGHLYTTDMMATLWFVTTYLSFVKWIDTKQSKWWWLSVLGLSLLAATKIVAVPMVGTAMLVTWQWHRKSWLALFNKSLDWKIFLLGGVVIWASYGFTWYEPFEIGFKLPLGGFIHTFGRASCFVACEKYQATRNLIYFEDVSHTGWWSYPVVAFFIKTSITVTMTWMLLGVKKIRSELWILLPPIISVIAWVTLARYNIGVRHLLPAIPFLAIAAGLLVVDWWQDSEQKYFWKKLFAAAMVLLHLATALTTSDYLSYFNPLVGTKLGGKIMADSNLDWGQNLYRLSLEINSEEIQIVGDIFLASTSPYSPHSDYDLNTKYLPPAEKLNLSDLSGHTIIIGRTSWYLNKYSHHPQLSQLNPEYVVSDTMVMFKIP